MYCSKCGKQIEPGSFFCTACGMPLTAGMPSQPAAPSRPKFFTAGFVLGILSLCIPYHGFILGVIGLPMAIISKRKSSIIMNIVGLSFWVAIIFLITLTSILSFSSYAYSSAPGFIM